MTLRTVTDQLYFLSVGGYFNNEKFTAERLYNQCKSLFRGNLKAGNKLVMQIALPDGWWYFYIIQYAPNQYDYFIPATRNIEKRVIALLD